MRRFFVAPEAIEGEQLLLDGELAHHISRVLRMKEGDEAEFAPGDGRLYLGRLTEFSKAGVRVELLSVRQAPADTSVQVTIYQGLPKGDKLEWIIQKCTELGVARIVPVVTKRTVVRLDEAKGAKKVGRWQKIAQEASQQSKRLSVPEVGAPITWQQLLDTLRPEDVTLILWEDETTEGLKAFLQKQPMLPARLNLVIGPEGGLEEAEVAELRQRGAHSITLGSRILRTETAGLAALSMVLYQSGDLG